MNIIFEYLLWAVVQGTVGLALALITKRPGLAMIISIIISGLGVLVGVVYFQLPQWFMWVPVLGAILFFLGSLFVLPD